MASVFITVQSSSWLHLYHRGYSKNTVLTVQILSDINWRNSPSKSSLVIYFTGIKQTISAIFFSFLKNKYDQTLWWTRDQHSPVTSFLAFLALIYWRLWDFSFVWGQIVWVWIKKNKKKNKQKNRKSSVKRGDDIHGESVSEWVISIV